MFLVSVLYRVLFLRPWHVSPLPSKEPVPYQAAEDMEPRVVDWYLTDLEANRIEETKCEDFVYLIIKTKNLVGQTISVGLDNPEVDYIYNGERLKNDVLSDYTIASDEEKVKLKVVKQEKA